MKRNDSGAPEAMLAASPPGGIVFLDVAGDAYLCRYAPQTSAWPHTDDPLHPPAGRPLPAAPARISSASTFHFLRALGRTLLDFGRYDFASLLASIERRPCPQGMSDPERYARAVAAFEVLCPFVPFRFLCLFRSYLLLRYLAYQGLGGTWMFGVSLFPFEAHCWVRAGDTLIGEKAERLESLSVIHSVEMGCR